MPEKWRNGNAYTDFADLMALNKIDKTTFASAAPAYSPGGFTRAFGGHVYAQAAYAAAQTVREGFVLHVCMSLSRGRVSRSVARVDNGKLTMV